MPRGSPRASPGAAPAAPVAQDEPRAGAEGFVIVEPDAVKTKAPSTTGRKAVWTSTAVVLVAGWHSAWAEATAEGLGLQVAALLLELGVLQEVFGPLEHGRQAAPRPSTSAGLIVRG